MTGSQALALRYRIVLAAADGERSVDIAARLGCNPSTVGKWRVRFAAQRLDGLHDEPRPGKPRTIGDEDVERVIVKTLEEKPRDATHWSTRSMAAATGMSQTAISRIWRAFGKRGTHRSTRQLTASIRTWIERWNDEPRPFIWHKAAAEILDSLASYRQRINDSGH